MANKYALLIGTSEYHDERLARLKTPAADVDVLAELLRNPDIGGYEVKLLLNEQFADVLKEIVSFLKDRNRDDHLLLYFSGHGVMDEGGNLYLATQDTERDLLSATALSSKFIKDEMDRSRSKRQVLILDCCHSGAFMKGTKGAGPALTQTTFEGYGRAVLTAADSVQYALEGDQVEEGLELSLFTHFLTEGIQTGEADRGNDGWIELDEWFDYAFRKVRDHTDKQTPRKFVDNQYGELFIARNPKASLIRPAELPERLRARIKSEYKPDRLEAIQELQGLFDSDDPSMVMAAQAALERIAAADDSLSIRSSAASILTQYAERLAALKGEEERLAREKAEVKRLASLKAEEKRQARERAEAERQATLKANEERKRAEAERLAALEAEESRKRAEAERLEALKAEEERQARLKAETERQSALQAEEERRTRQEAELLARLAAEEEQPPAQEMPITEGGWMRLRSEIRYAIQVWVSALLKPSSKTYEALVNDPRASAKRAFIWMLASAFIYGLLTNIEIGGSFSVYWVTLISLGSIAVFYLIIGVVYWISRILGGRRGYSRMIFANAAFTMPLLLFTAILSVINSFGWISWSGEIIILTWIYAIGLSVIATKAIHKFGLGRAIDVYIISLIGIPLLVYIIIIAIS